MFVSRKVKLLGSPVDQKLIPLKVDTSEQYGVLYSVFTGPESSVSDPGNSKKPNTILAKLNSGRAENYCADSAEASHDPIDQSITPVSTWAADYDPGIVV